MIKQTLKSAEKIKEEYEIELQHKLDLAVVKYIKKIMQHKFFEAIELVSGNRTWLFVINGRYQLDYIESKHKKITRSTYEVDYEMRILDNWDLKHNNEVKKLFPVKQLTNLDFLLGCFAGDFKTYPTSVKATRGQKSISFEYPLE